VISITPSTRFWRSDRTPGLVSLAMAPLECGVVIPCAYLRVFRPLDSYTDDERVRWERYILSGGAPASNQRVYRDEATVMHGHVGLLASEEGDHADIRLVEGLYYLCPWRTRLRVLAGILSLRGSLRESAPPEMVDAFVPETEARRAARELAKLKRRDPSVGPAMLQSPWHVPVRWFILVGDEERRLTETTPGEFRLYYWTPIERAKRRAQRALQVLRHSELAPVAQLVREMAQWLSAFHPQSMVELDYAGVSSLFSWDELDNDHGGQEIQEAVEALAHPGGMGRAAELYQTVASRWADAMSRESMN
jgi:hypothetical protein